MKKERIIEDDGEKAQSNTVSDRLLITDYIMGFLYIAPPISTSKPANKLTYFYFFFYLFFFSFVYHMLMRRNVNFHSLFLRRHQAVSQNFVARPPLTRHVSRNVKQESSYHNILPSQLLRSALTDPSEYKGNSECNWGKYYSLHDIFCEEWPLNTPPLPVQTWLQPQTPIWNSDFLTRTLYDVKNIRQIERFVEGIPNGSDIAAIFKSSHFELLSQAFERCQNHNLCSEILLAINSIVARIETYGTSVPGSLHILGMQYACCCHSISALKNHLEGYYRVSSQRLDSATSLALVKSLISFIDAAKFNDPGFDSSIALDFVTGEGHFYHSSQHRLHDILSWADTRGSPVFVEHYALLLAKLQSYESFHKTWNRFVESLSSNVSQDTFQTAYACVLALVNAENTEAAVSCLELLSEHAGNRLPGISKFGNIDMLLANETINEILPRIAGEEEFVGILENELERIEKSLGIKWQADRSVHSTISDSLSNATEQPLFTIDGDSVGFDSKDRLVGEICSFACSNSQTGLGRISDLLDEHDGRTINITLPGCKDKSIEFAWVPHRSPLDFSGASSETNFRMGMPMSRPPPALGLIRMQILSNKDLMKSEVTLHLMQLGYLVFRPVDALLKDSESQNKWQESGHVVTLDRETGQLLAIFVGDHHAFLEAGVKLPSIPFQFGLGFVANIALSDYDRSNMPPGQISIPYENLDIRLHLEADSGTNLKV